MAPTDNFGERVKNLLIPFAGAFATALINIILICIISSSFRPKGLDSDVRVKLEDKGFSGVCNKCEEHDKFVMVCDADVPEGRQLWAQFPSAAIPEAFDGNRPVRYYQQLPPALDLEHWCKYSDLGQVLRGGMGIAFPLVLVVVLYAGSVIFDVISDDTGSSLRGTKAGAGVQIKDVTITIVTYAVVFMILWLIAEAIDDSPQDSTAAVLYVFSMVSLAIYVPGRLTQNEGTLFSKTFVMGKPIFMLLLWLPPLAYSFVLAVALGMVGRAFHITADMWKGFGLCWPLMIVVVTVHLLVLKFLGFQSEASEYLNKPPPQEFANPAEREPIADSPAPIGRDDVAIAVVDETNDIPDEPRAEEPKFALPEGVEIVPEWGDPDYEEIAI